MCWTTTVGGDGGAAVLCVAAGGESACFFRIGPDPRLAGASCLGGREGAGKRARKKKKQDIIMASGGQEL